jgi:ubiquinone/menaquinone biosynthesis C-methylase UbiE
MPRAAQFSPGVIDYDGPMSASYHSGRALSAEAASTWCATAAPFVRAAQCARVLDLGSGTGRFATLFARSFETQVIGIEPSKGMLAAAAREERPENLAYVAGAAECIPLKKAVVGLSGCHMSGTMFATVTPALESFAGSSVAGAQSS